MTTITNYIIKIHLYSIVTIVFYKKIKIFFSTVKLNFNSDHKTIECLNNSKNKCIKNIQKRIINTTDYLDIKIL